MSMERFDLAALNGADGFILQGCDAYDASGWSVSGAGDVNGDGFADIAVGAPYAEPDASGFDVGQSYVVFGRAGGFPAGIDLATLDGSDGFVLDGSRDRDLAGISVASAGDVNGDGFDDLLVGAPAASAAGRAYAGNSYVVFGRAGGFPAAIDLADLDGDGGFVLQGAARSDYSGVSVSSAGDVDGDGLDDLIVGATYASAGGSWSGSSYVVFGRAGGWNAALDLSTLDGSRGFRLDGAADWDQSGVSVASAGDIDGDGLDDLIVGAGGADPNGQTDAGQSYVVFGRAGDFPAVIALADLDGGDGFAIDGIAAYDLSGVAVGGVGDVNGDGFDDVGIGAVRADPQGRSSAGAGYVIFGHAGGFPAAVDLADLDGGNGFAIGGIDAYDVLGMSIDSAGDVNGDGFDDLIVAAHAADPDQRSNAGEIYVVFGRASGFPARIDLSDLDGSEGFVLDGAQADALAGFSVGGAGDVDGDGFDDLIVGAPLADPDGRTSAGESYVVFGGNISGAVDHLGTAADDTLAGRVAPETLFGAQGDDLVLGRRGGDSINGGSGDDTLIGGGGGDTATGGSGDDCLQGNASGDRLQGDGGNDVLSGDGGGDHLDGGGGHDLLQGGSGNDTLIGDAAGDVLSGGDGADVLTGGRGGDSFSFGEASHAAFAVGDTITDFRSGFDHLVLNDLAAGGVFVGAAAFAAGGAIEARFDAARGQLQVDLNNDGRFGSGDLQIDGLGSVTAGDVLFV